MELPPTRRHLPQRSLERCLPFAIWLWPRIKEGFVVKAKADLYIAGLQGHAPGIAIARGGNFRICGQWNRDGQDNGRPHDMQNFAAFFCHSLRARSQFLMRGSKNAINYGFSVVVINTVAGMPGERIEIVFPERRRVNFHIAKDNRAYCRRRKAAPDGRGRNVGDLAGHVRNKIGIESVQLHHGRLANVNFRNLVDRHLGFSIIRGLSWGTMSISVSPGCTTPPREWILEVNDLAGDRGGKLQAFLGIGRGRMLSLAWVSSFSTWVSSLVESSTKRPVTSSMRKLSSAAFWRDSAMLWRKRPWLPW